MGQGRLVVREVIFLAVHLMGAMAVVVVIVAVMVAVVRKLVLILMVVVTVVMIVAMTVSAATKVNVVVIIEVRECTRITLRCLHFYNLVRLVVGLLHLVK